MTVLMSWPCHQLNRKHIIRLLHRLHPLLFVKNHSRKISNLVVGTQLINTQRREQEKIFNRKQRCSCGIEKKIDQNGQPIGRLDTYQKICKSTERSIYI